MHHVLEAKLVVGDLVSSISSEFYQTRNAKNFILAGRINTNLLYHSEHTSSHHYITMKYHYLLTQIADILMQLFEIGLKILKSIKKTAKEISSNF